MASPEGEDDRLFRDAVRGLERGDFSRLEPLFDEGPSLGGHRCRIIAWYEASHPVAAG